MKILYVGSLAKTACSTFYLKALQALGHNVFTYDPIAFETSNFVEQWRVRITKSPTTHRIRCIEKEILTLCKENAFDVVMVIAENFLPNIFDEIRATRKPSPRFLYHSHDNNFSPGILKPDHFFETLAKYDALFTTKSQNVERYKQLGNSNAHFIPSAFEPTFHRPVSGTGSSFQTKEVGVGFVGTYDYSRNKFLDAVGWNDLYIWGNNWTRYQSFRKHRAHITPHAIYLDEYADVVSHTKISLGLLREEAEDFHTQRTFEIPACRSLQVAPRNNEIRSFFEEDKEIVCFGSPEELKEKVSYYLRHETERLRIAQAGFERCIKDGHTYLNRVREMLRIASEP